MSRPRRFIVVSVGFSDPDHLRLSKIADLRKCSKADVIRFAIAEFLNNHDQIPAKEHESLLELRLRKLENRLADLTVLATRASAQTLYFLSLPFAKGGFPQRPLKEEAFRAQWEKSRTFASQFLKNAHIEPQANLNHEEQEK